MFASLARFKIYLPWITLGLPWFIAFFPKTNKFDHLNNLDPILLLSGLVFLIAAWRLKDKSLRRDLKWDSWSAAFLMLFILWSSLSFFLNPFRDFGFAEIYALWIGTLIFFFWRAQEEFKKALPMGMTLILLVSVAIGIYGFLTTDHSRFFGFFYDPSVKADAWPNAFASQILLLFPWMIYAFFFDTEKKSGWFTLKCILVGITLASFYLSFSRAGFVSFALGMGLFGIGYWIQKKNPKLNWKSFLSAILIISLSAGIAFHGIRFLKDQKDELINVHDRFTFNEAEGSTSYTERLEFFQGSLKLIQEKPIFGYGPSSFVSIYPQVQEGFLALASHPHNILFKLALERGIPSLCFFLVFLLALFIQSHPFKKNGTLYDLFAWCGVLALMAHHMLDYNLNFFSIDLCLWMILSGTSIKKLGKSRTAILAILSLMFLLFSFGGKLVWDTFEFRKILNNPSIAEIESFEPIMSRYWVLSLREVNLDNAEIEEALLLKQLELNPYDSFTWNLLGEFQVKENRLNEAITSFGKALNLNPKNTFLYSLNLAKALAVNGDLEALNELKVHLIPLMQEYIKLYRANLHYTQATREMEFMVKLCYILGISKSDLYPLE